MVAPKSKRELERDAVFAKGGRTPMAGKGDRTTTAASDAAGAQKPGSTAHKTAGKNLQHAVGGKAEFTRSVAIPAKAAQTVTSSVRKKGR